MDALKNAEISRRILARVANGEAMPTAYDAELGAGKYAELVSNLYGALRAKAGK